MITRRMFITTVVILILAAIVVFFVLPHHPKNTTNSSTATVTKPLSEAIDVSTKFIQARENAVGADQPTPSSWLTNIKSLVTDSLFSTLQPAGSTTSNTSADFYTSHSNGYLVKANLTDCSWIVNTSDTASGIISCALNDSTIDQKTGA